MFSDKLIKLQAQNKDVAMHLPQPQSFPEFQDKPVDPYAPKPRP